MDEKQKFDGFYQETVQFLFQLKRNNNKDWFHKYKKEYESLVLEPAKLFVASMGEKLRSISPGLLAVPKINKSLFRIYRDTRFSPDKSPYKTHLGIYFWEGSRPRMECSGFYFHLEPPVLMIGVGIYMFPKQDVSRFRKAVVDPEAGRVLSRVLKKIPGLDGFELGGKHYKRIPAGYDPAHPNAEILLYNGLYVGKTEKIPEELYSSRLLNFCFQRFKALAPLHNWLVGIGIGSFTGGSL
jgi:uncharacterized protein (TIGR02453 family)